MKDPFQDEMLEHRAKAPAIKGIKFVKRVQEHYDKCPECGGKLIHEAGCLRCTCGWSACG